MEEYHWKRDETPYIIFTCKKCGRYLYVKPTQKTKKCLGCGRTHQVKSIKAEEIAKGMTEAVNRVKQLQNELALKELGGKTDLRANNDFKITSVFTPISEHKKKEETKKIKREKIKNDYSEGFRGLLIQISKRYKKFPEHLIEALANEHSIPLNQISFLKNTFVKQGVLRQLKYGYYKVVWHE
ncbi:MAG: DUF1922 domain-containing protein [Promethearchaeota archaeon]